MLQLSRLRGDKLNNPALPRRRLHLPFQLHYPILHETVVERAKHSRPFGRLLDASEQPLPRCSLRRTGRL
jgi:hypothetical protein